MLINDVYQTNKFGAVSIVKCVSYREVYVKFVDTGYEVKTRVSNIIGGDIKERLAPSVYGVGILGGSSTSYESRNIKEYHLWSDMLERCYSDKRQQKQPTYIGCTVSENFKNFSYFKFWCSKQIGFNLYKWTLDKDILFKGNKFYSEDTCVFVPQEINKLFTKTNALRGSYPIGVNYHKRDKNFVAQINKYGKKKMLGNFKNVEDAFLAYKWTKEAYIKEVANKWKDQIDPRVYEALMKYQVDITD